MPSLASVVDMFDAPPKPTRRPIGMTVMRDAILVAGLTILTAVLCARFNVSELLHRWTAPWERIQLDEWPAILLALASGLLWFALRRFSEARRALAHHEAAESRASLALAHVRRLSRNYVEVQEQERRSIARELHDELGQYLQVIKLDAVGLRDSAAFDPGALAVQAQAIVNNCNHIHAMLTGLLQRLRPVGLDELGLVAALEHCIQGWQPRMPATTLAQTVTGEFNDVSEDVALAIFRLVQESLTNIAKHAGATKATVQLWRANANSIVVTVSDDGIGFDVETPTQGLGLIGMQERISALGGHFILDAVSGRGTRVEASIPVTQGGEFRTP